jgi:hypothetical protein
MGTTRGRSQSQSSLPRRRLAASSRGRQGTGHGVVDGYRSRRSVDADRLVAASPSIGREPHTGALCWEGSGPKAAHRNVRHSLAMNCTGMGTGQQAGRLAASSLHFTVLLYNLRPYYKQ